MRKVERDLMMRHLTQEPRAEFRRISQRCSGLRLDAARTLLPVAAHLCNGDTGTIV